MSFPRYERYKDSGVEWLSEVPEHWTVVPIKHLGELKGGSGFPHEQQGVEGAELCFYKVGDLAKADALGVLQESEDTVTRETAVQLGAFVFPPQTIVFAKVGAALLLGRLRTLPANSCIDNNMMGLLIDHQTYDVRFVNYAMTLIRFDYLANPGAVPSLNGAQVGDFSLTLPGKQEQVAIASFLSEETEKIDGLVEEQRRLIELLKEKRQALITHAITRGLNSHAPMKDSGIEWLGIVPAEWQIVRIGSIFRDVNEQGVEGLAILSVSIHHGVSDKQLDDDELDRKVTRSDDQTKYKRVAPADLVYNMMRAWQGGFGTVTVEGMVSPAYVVARPTEEFSTAFVELVLRTSCAIEEMRRYSQGVTDFRLRLYWDNFKSIQIALPSPLEQEKILAFIQTKTSEFDRLTAVAQEAIDLLQERRTALISAVVTGKIDVRSMSDTSGGRSAWEATQHLEAGVLVGAE